MFYTLRMQVEYREEPCKAALNRVRGMPFEWSLNPYMGCVHRCTFCYVRAFEKRADRPSDHRYGTSIRVKVNVADVLRTELARRSWCGEEIVIGAATDPYQPAEGRYRLTRACLEVRAEAANPFGLITRGPMIVRDVDVLAEAARRADVTVTFSVPTLDPEVWRRTEPGTAPLNGHAIRARSLLPGTILGGLHPAAKASAAATGDRAISQPQEHGIKTNQAQHFAVELAHLAEHIGLLDALDDQPVLDPNVVEEAGLERALGGRGAVQPPGRCPADRPVREGDVAVGHDLGQLHPQIGKPLPDPADGLLGLVPVHEAPGEPDTVLPVAGRIDELRRLIEVLPVHGVYEPVINAGRPGQVTLVARVHPDPSARLPGGRYHQNPDYLNTDDKPGYPGSMAPAGR